MININHDALRSGDRVLCGGKSPFATVTRVVTSGWENWKNYDIAVHTGVIIDVYGQKLIAEMQPKGLEFNSLERYIKPMGKRFILDITRSPVFDKEETRHELEKLIAYYRRKTIEYDYVGLLEFVFPNIKDKKNKNYCSEFDYRVTKKLGCHYPKRFEIKVSPYNLQKVDGWSSVSEWEK